MHTMSTRLVTSATAVTCLVPIVMLAAGPLAAFAQAQQTQGPPWPGPWWMWEGAGWWWVMPIMAMLAFWAIVIAIIVVIIRKFVLEARQQRGDWLPPWSATHSALQILNERFARGEIEKEEFEQKRATILALHDRDQAGAGT